MVNIKTVLLFTIIISEVFAIFYVISLPIIHYKLSSYTKNIINGTENTKEIPEYIFNITRPSDNPKIIFELIPNTTVLYDGTVEKLSRITHININSDGFRDKEYSLAKPNNTFRIIILGDSQTFGWGFELEETYSKLLEKKLNSLTHEVNFEVLNFAVPGYNTLDEVEFFKDKGLKYEPDFVIIGYIHNDMIDNFELSNLYNKMVDEKLKNISAKNISDSEYNFMVINITFEVVVKFENQVFNNKTLFDDYWEKIVEIPLNELNNITKEKNISIIIVTLTYNLPKNQIIRLENLTEKYNWHLIDMNDVFLKYNFFDLTVGKLDTHWNPFASKLIGEQIYNYLIKNQLVPLDLKHLSENQK